MRCIYYCCNGDDRDLLLSSGISHGRLHHPDDPPVLSMTCVYPLRAAVCAGAWKQFAWRYDKTKQRTWAHVMIDFPDDIEVHLRYWGCTEIWNKEMMDAHDGGTAHRLFDEHELVCLSLDDAIQKMTGDNLDAFVLSRFFPDEIEYCDGRLFVRSATAEQLDRELNDICARIESNTLSLLGTETGRLHTGLECLNVFFDGPIPSEWLNPE